MRRVAIILILVTVGSMSLPASQALARYNSCLLVYSDHAVEWCVAPAREAAAEHHMSVAPISPVAMVFASTGLSPIQIIFTTETVYSTRHVRSGTTSVHYLFGAVPAVHGYLRMRHTSSGSTSLEFPKFVLVQEIAGRYVPTSPREHRITCPPGLVGTSSLLDGIGGCGLWFFTQYIPARHLSVTVAGNVTAQQVRQIGVTVAHAD